METARWTLTGRTLVDHKAQHCYSVRFSARELWGPTAAERDTLRVDVFDDYMDLA